MDTERHGSPLPPPTISTSSHTAAYNQTTLSSSNPASPLTPDSIQQQDSATSPADTTAKRRKKKKSKKAEGDTGSTSPQKTRKRDAEEKKAESVGADVVGGAGGEDLMEASRSPMVQQRADGWQPPGGPPLDSNSITSNNANLVTPTPTAANGRSGSIPPMMGPASPSLPSSFPLSMAAGRLSPLPLPGLGKKGGEEGETDRGREREREGGEEVDLGNNTSRGLNNLYGSVVLGSHDEVQDDVNGGAAGFGAGKQPRDAEEGVLDQRPPSGGSGSGGVRDVPNREDDAGIQERTRSINRLDANTSSEPARTSPLPALPKIHPRLDPLEIQRDTEGRLEDIMRARPAPQHRRVASARTAREEKSGGKDDERRGAGARGRLMGLSVSAEERERDRLVGLRTLGVFEVGRDSRLDQVTTLTARLLDAELCILTIVDQSVVHWWSVCDRGGYLPPSMQREPRADSFCHYAIRDDKRGGFVVLDARREGRFREKPLVRRGLEFYAGAPIVTSNGTKVGALSIRGPARQTFTSPEAELLKQMTEWATGEIEVLIRKYEQSVVDSLGYARARMATLEKGRDWGEEKGRGVIGQVLDIMRNTLRAKNVMILKINTTSDGSIRSIIHSIASPCHLTIGDEKFTDLTLACLDKSHPTALIMDPHPISLQLQVGRFVGQDVMRSASDIIWAYGRPVGVVVAFFEGEFRAITHMEEQFTSEAATTLSNIWERVDTHESLNYIMSPSFGANLLHQRLTKLKKSNRNSISSRSSSSFGSLVSVNHRPGWRKPGTSQQKDEEDEGAYGLPFVMIVEPFTPGADDHVESPVAPHLANRPKTSLHDLAPHTPAAKGLEQAHAIARMRNRHRPDANLPSPANVPGVPAFLDVDLHPKLGRKGVAITGVDDDGKTCHDLISMVLDLSLTLAEYEKETGVTVLARVGIHGDEIPVDLANDLESVEAAWRAIVNTAYHLETISNSSILLSDVVKDYADDEYSFMNRGVIFTRGMGASKVYALIGPEDGSHEDALAAVEDRARRAREAAEAAVKEREEKEKEKEEEALEEKKVKSRTCRVM
ncbi:hypothetical protein HDU97_010010 [Phlyctochytrium planicorne]|nr:hypothetical protein HDU97_010010 [Phlyctochytrium planicorne]